jgi:hypothetical protein
MGEACIRDYLRRSFGTQWFLKEETGAFLIELWKEGERWGLDGLMRRLGHDPLDDMPLREAFSELACPSG